MGNKERELFKLLEMYMDMAEKQDEVIYRLAAIVKRQAGEIQQMKNVYGFFEESAGNREEDLLAKEAMEQYESMKTGEI